MENNSNEIDINDLFKKTANRIIKWHNEVPDMPDIERLPALQALTHLIIQDIGEKIGDKLGLKLNLEIAMSPELRKKVNDIKKTEGNFLTGDNKLKKMLPSEDEDDYLS